MAAIRLVEVGPRDGLQNEKQTVPTSVKIDFVRALGQAGYQEIEATSFVSPRWVPQLVDAAQVSAALSHNPPGPTWTALVPNLKGLEGALASDYRRVAVFTAASEAFSQKNTNRSVAQSMLDFAPLMELARERKVSVRGYLSTVWHCPYSGPVDPNQVVPLVRQLLELGVDEVSLGDTVGRAVPTGVRSVLQALFADGVSPNKLALHMHDTSGTALANVLVGLEMGITTFDCSAGGLGGCPYAPGASGNLASEDLIYMLEGMGLDTGVNLERVARASLELAGHLGRTLPSRCLARLQGELA